MLNFLQGKEKLVPRPAKIDIFRSFIGGALSIFVLLKMTEWTGYTWILGSFGATCVLLYAASQSPLAQPRNVILGHLVTAIIGLVFLKFWGLSLIAIAVSVGLGIAMMQLLQCVHPPAGANPLIILLTAPHVQYHWDFLIFPILIGSVSLVCIAFLVNNIASSTKWPLYGLGIFKSKAK